MNPHIQTIVCALSSLRIPATPTEYDLHAWVASALERAGLPFVHEYSLAPRCRIDFFVEGVGIEIKKGRPNVTALKRQLSRYLSSDELSAIIVIVQKAVPLPDSIGGKPVYQISLNRLWGVALP